MIAKWWIFAESGHTGSESLFTPITPGLFLFILGFSIRTRTYTGSRVCGDYILIFRKWMRSIDRLTENNTARWIDG